MSKSDGFWREIELSGGDDAEQRERMIALLERIEAKIGD